MKPSVAKFTKENPCTKLLIWNCFRGTNGFLNIPVVDAQAIIGANVPRVMEREGRLVRKEVKSIEYYVLTEEGIEWLYEGFKRYLKNHPAHAAKAKHVPKAWGYTEAPARLRRTR